MIGPNNFICSVADLDRSIAFYRDTFGFEPRIQPGRAGRLPGPARLDNALSNLTDTHGANYRSVTMDLPDVGFDLKLTEFTGVERNAVQARLPDPGVAMLIFTVRAAKTALTAAEKAGARVVTLGGEPIYFPGRNGSGRYVVILRDPDGIFIELSQPNPLPSSATPGKQVIGGEIATIVEDMEKTVDFYRNAFGLDFKPPTSSPPFNLIANLADAIGSQYRVSRAALPGRAVIWFLIEFQNIDRKPFQPRIVDPGATGLSLHVHDADALIDRVRAGGGAVVSRGGRLGSNPGSILVRDPNGFLIELIQGSAY